METYQDLVKKVENCVDTPVDLKSIILSFMEKSYHYGLAEGMQKAIDMVEKTQVLLHSQYNGTPL